MNQSDCNIIVRAATYTTMVRPILEHAPCAWDHISRKISSNLNRSNIGLPDLHSRITVT